MRDLVQRDGVYYEKFSDVPFSGKVTGSFNGLIMNGKREGAWILYWNNGQLYSKRNYKNGKKEGAWVEYEKDGTLYRERSGTFKNGYKIR